MTKRITYYLTPDQTKDEMMAIIGEGLVEQERGNIPIISVQKAFFDDNQQLELVKLILKRAESNGFGVIIEPASSLNQEPIRDTS